MVFTLLKASVQDWDILANRFYEASYTPRCVHLYARIWYEGIDNEVVLLPHHVLGPTAGQLIEALLQFHPLTNRRNPNSPQEVRNSSFLEGYVLPAFLVYKGYMDP